MSCIQPVELSGRRVRLEPLSLDHEDGLCDAVKDGELWNLWYTSVPSPDEMRAEITRRLEAQDRGTMIAYTIRDLSDARIIGMTTFMNIDATVPRVEIGSTWSAASSQGTGINAESKLLMLTQAFEQWGCSAVEFRTSWHNHRSRAAIEKLGAKLDGVLRQHTRTLDGSLRDTCVYSVIATEWPQVRSSLRYRLGLPVVGLR
ncbi:GNAT family N-acetyltransferase [Corynebacterium sp. AOP40-9SA-29]|uniref:GNAT family N-acetyltransferase n=1 Tax=Corynebacterium sp. AOP40-9SA-29 TaxID=3457677 RepID=UPI00403317E0